MTCINKCLLKIWSKIKRLFGKGKMEIDETINKWLTLLDNELASIRRQLDTEHRMSDEQKHIYHYCSLVKTLAGNYSTSVLQLCNKGEELPAKILLRTLAELVIKFSWCICKAHKDISAFFVSCEKWTKNSLKEQKKFLKRAFECFGDKQIEQNLKECQDGIDKLINTGNMPDNAQLCKDLFGNEGSLNCFILFGSLHEVVHSDLALLQKLKVGDKGTLISDDGEIIKPICMACIYLLLK